MSEITKLYKNAGVKKEVIKGCYEYYSELGIDIWKENDCRGKNCDTCKKDKSIKRYPPFTAEKQLNILKIIVHSFGFNSLDKPIWDKGWDIAIAKLVNIYWQDLTEEEKTSIKNILEM